VPDAFAISSPTTTVTGRKGQATFTVTNATGRPVRVRGSVSGTDPVTPGWFTLTPSVEQDCVIGGTVQYTVDVLVPDAIAPATYPVKFTTAAEDRPEEDYSELAWSLVVPPADTKPKKFPVWIPIAVLVLLVVVGVVAWLLTRDGDEEAAPPTTTTELVTTTTLSGKVAVPDVDRQNPTAAAKKMDDAGLKAVIIPAPARAAAANEFPCVLASFPSAGTLVDRGSQVGILSGLCASSGTKPVVGLDEVVLCSKISNACTNNRLRDAFRNDIEEDARLGK
jgi:hypothetical protein